TAAIAARTFPWFCWEQGFVGILGPVLGASMDEAGAFVTCGPGGLMPTSALFHLSDGLEDYEYLKEYEEAVRRGKLDPPPDFRPGFLLPPAVVGLDDHASRALELVREQRKRMGRLLSGQRTVTRNFGPRS
ncbi:MAG: hypothetical protein Q8N51_19950, partial [Gammaproteobacteria bacterium]|nr:hypothetical protein [Gammaproteobacteria bacterium]